MDLYPAIARNIAYPLFDRLRGRRLCRRLRELEASQWWSAEEVRARQLHKLRALLVHAGQHVPYYAGLFAERGFDPAAITRLEDARALPILTKEIIKARQEELIATNFPRAALVPGRTGGSTGVPTHFYFNVDALDYIRAAVLRNLEWAGLRVGEKYCKVSASRFDSSLMQQRVSKVVQWLLRQRHLSAMDISDPSLREAVALIRAFKPTALWGYASAIHHLAAFMEANGLDAPVKTIITSSETLFPEMRATIERAFGCRVFDAYGSRETSIAAECAHHAGMHINAEIVYLEVVDAAGAPCRPGEPGRLLVTDLNNYGFPFIRYEIGDVAALREGTCPCGRGLPLMEHLEGRVDDFIVTPAGKWFSPRAVTVLFNNILAIKEYQCVQREPDTLTVFIRKGDGFSAEVEEYITDSLRALLGDELRFALHYVDQIDRGESGKRRVVVSTVARGAGREAPISS